MIVREVECSESEPSRECFFGRIVAYLGSTKVLPPADLSGTALGQLGAKLCITETPVCRSYLGGKIALAWQQREGVSHQ
jgi:hypothetical protein